MKAAANTEQAWLERMRAGKACFARGDLAGSARAFKSAIELRQDKAEGWINLGSTLLQGQQFADAASALKTAAALQPGLAITHMLLGDAQRLLGKTADALASYHRSVELERSPMGLNRLACALRADLQTAEAESLYREALELAPNMTIVRVNLATLHIEKRQFAEAQELLGSLSGAKLPPPEREEVASASRAIAEHQRLAPAITQLIDDGDYRPLEALLSDLPRDMRKVDTGALERARQYLDWAAANPQPTSLPLEPLPEEWPLVEAMFMIPLADDVASFLELREQLADSSGLSGDLLDSANIAPAVRRARACRDNMRTPVQIEAGVRHWHAIASEGCAGLHPGHFKYTQNWSARNPLLKRVDPALASATFQCFVEEIYTRVPPGMLRAAICMMVLCDLHVFADGNGRIGTIWMNRELEWNDCMPALFRRDLSLKGELATAMTTVRGNGGDLSPLLSVMLRAQHHARDFCRELAAVT